MCNCKNEELEIDGKYLYVEDHKNIRYEINFCPICGDNVQPERSKQEDSITYLEDLDKNDYYKLVRKFGEIERKCREMRCSEHCGNTVRDK